MTEQYMLRDFFRALAELINQGQASGEDLENYVDFNLHKPCYMQAMWAKTEPINRAIEGKAWVN